VSARTRLLPNRLDLLRATRRLQRITKGAGLLRRKREALVVALFRLARPAADSRRLIDESARTGYDALVRALAVHGGTGLAPFSWPGREIELQIEAGQVWGIPVATITARPPVVRMVAARGFAPGSAGPATTATAAAFERLSELLLDAASREMLIRRLGAALAQTSRQVHTLERRIAPLLARQMAGVRRTLEEREREEHLRLKHLARHAE
jgi:V/A-type H+-transporting ATPase subunit D